MSSEKRRTRGNSRERRLRRPVDPLSSPCTLVRTLTVLSIPGQGVTGFGAAILTLSVWAFFSVVTGLDVGPLEKIVALEGFIGLVATLPMTAVVNVKGSTSWLILGSFMPTQVACIPVGAALLTWVDPASMELSAGVIILAFLVTQTKLATTLRVWCSRGREWIEGAFRGILRDAGRYEAVGDAGMGGSGDDGEGGGWDGVSTVCVTATKAKVENDVEMAAATREARDAGGVEGSNGKDGVTHSESPLDAHTDAPAQAERMKAPATFIAPHAAAASMGVENNERRDLEDTDEDLEEAGGDGQGTAWPCSWEGVERTQRWLARRGPERSMFGWRGTRLGFITVWGIGGVVSGVLGGATGVVGPPAIALYSYLKVDKAVVRATSTTMGTAVLVVRLLSYIALGIMQIDDAWLYGWCSLVGLVGVASGHLLSGLVDEKMFNGVMLVVLLLGAGLMLFKGFDGGGGGG